MADLTALTTRPDPIVEHPEDAAGVSEPAADDDLVLDDELLVEDVSIDGMCGVY
jgi:mycofactocin precursor